MKTGRTLAELAAELDRTINTRKDYIAPQGKIEAAVVGDNTIVVNGVNGGGMELTEHAHRQVAEHLGIPQRYYDVMRTKQPALAVENINTWLHADAAEGRMVRTLDGKIRAFLSPRYRPMDNHDLAQVIIPELITAQAQVVSAELTETRMYVKAILPGLSDELPAGMVWGNGHNAIAEYRGNGAGRVVAAIVISNSEVGNGALRVEPSVFTTWCTNLAIMKEVAMKKYHVGRSLQLGDESTEIFADDTREANDKALWLKVRDVTRASFDVKVFQQAVARIKAATAEKIESQDLAAVVEVTVSKLAIAESSQGSILTYLAQGGDLSKWGLSSAISAVANNTADYETATALERAAGEVLALPKASWQEIAAA